MFLLLLLVVGCFQAEPPLPPHEALARTAQDIQQIIDEERKLPVEPVRFAQETPANPNEIDFWFCSHPLVSHAILAHPDRVEAFLSVHPGLRFNHQFIGDWGVAIQKLTVTLAAGDVPDIALVKRAWFVRLIDTGWIVPLDSFLPATLLDDFHPAALEPLRRDGHLYGLPADGFCSVLYYDKGKLQGLPPKTWDELRSCLRALTKPDTDPRKAVYGIGDMPFLETLWSAGGEVCDATRCLLGSDTAREAIDFIVSLKTEGLLFPHPTDGVELLLRGRTAMTVAGSEYLPCTRGAEFPIGLAPVPGKKGPISRQSDNVLVVFAKRAEGKRAAISAVLDFLTGPAVQDRDALQNGSFPVRRSCGKETAMPEGLEAAYVVSRNTPILPSWAAIEHELDRLTQALRR